MEPDKGASFFFEMYCAFEQDGPSVRWYCVEISKVISDLPKVLFIWRDERAFASDLGGSASNEQGN